MNCEEAVEKVWQFLDKELDEASFAEMQKHLEECRHCFSKVEFEERLRVMLRRSCCSEKAPAELRERLTRLMRLF